MCIFLAELLPEKLVFLIGKRQLIEKDLGRVMGRGSSNNSSSFRFFLILCKSTVAMVLCVAAYVQLHHHSGHQPGQSPFQIHARMKAL